MSTANDAPSGNDRHNDVNVVSIAIIGFVSVILLVVIVVSTQAYFYSTQDAEIYRKDVSQPSWQLANLLLQQQTELTRYRVVDPSKKIVAIPIDVAIKRYVERQATQPSG